MNGRYLGIAILCLILLIGVPVIVGVIDMIGPGYTFQREIHGHMENAYYADEPELMKEQLLLAIEGMENLKLEENMYSAFWQWEKTPDKRMDYQFKHLRGIIERVDAVIEWREQTYGEGSTSTEQLGDVFEQKMDNLRGFLQEDGWSDWIARGTFYVNHHLFLFFWNGLLAWIWVVIWTILTVVSFLIAIEF